METSEFTTLLDCEMLAFPHYGMQVCLRYVDEGLFGCVMVHSVSAQGSSLGRVGARTLIDKKVTSPKKDCKFFIGPEKPFGLYMKLSKAANKFHPKRCATVFSSIY